jgi:molybdopterin synthase sulfur carrier subunit
LVCRGLIMIKLLFFGRLGDFAQGVSTSIDAVDGLTPAAVRDGLAAGHPQLVYELSQPQVLISLNQMIVDWDHPIVDGAELAFLPPVTGG